MAHIRYRQLTPVLDQCLQFSPLVGITGHRQVGKTTLLENLSQSYYSLDDEESLAYLVSSAAEFIREIAGPRPVGIDEAQLMPEIFPALKEWVRKKKTPGQFLLSGSIRFTSLRSIRESLTGRIVTLELLPLTFNELHEMPPPELLSRLHAMQKFGPSINKAFVGEKMRNPLAKLMHYAQFGGLPGICFVRNDRLRNARIQTQLDTLLDRDLRLVSPTRLSLGDLQSILRQLALRQGQKIVLTELFPQRRLSSATINSVISGLESIFLIRKIPVLGDQPGFTIFFEDLAEHLYCLAGEKNEFGVQAHLLFSLVRGAFAYREEISPRMFQFRTRAGTLVPLVIESNERSTGFIPINGKLPDRRENAAATAFLSRYANGKVIFCSAQTGALKVLDERRLVLDWDHLTA